MMSPLPSISQAFSLIKQDEKQKQRFHLSAPFIGNVKEASKGGTSDANFGGGQKSGGLKSLLKCTYCNKEGHTREFCFKLVGYPDKKKTKVKAPISGFRHLPQASNSAEDI